MDDALDGILDKACALMQSMRLELGGMDKAVFYMPAFRNEEQLLRPPVLPDQLTFAPFSPWYMGDVLVKLAEKLGVSHVFVDLRAGLSELSSPIFLDPRVRRIMVTTTSRQSVEGTCLALKELAKIPSFVAETQTAYADNTRVIVNFIPPDDNGKADEIREEVESALQGLVSEASEDVNTFDMPSWVLHADYDQSLLGLGTLQSALNIFTKSVSLQDVCKTLWQESAPPAKEAIAEVSRNADIKKLEELTHSLIFAEMQDFNASTSVEAWKKKFLQISPYMHLAIDFAQKTPHACIVGAKGSGKTFLYQILSAMGSWSTFCEAMNGESNTDALLIPLYWSANLHGKAKKITQASYQHGVEHIQSTLSDKGLHEDATANYTHDKGHDFLIQHFSTVPSDMLNEIEWREKWYEFFVLALHIARHEDESCESVLKTWLSQQKQKIVFLFDGFEDLFSAWISKNSILPVSVFAQHIMEKVSEWSHNNVGILLFIRKDIITSAISQNSGQFLARYSKYELRWNREEALRLVGWVIASLGFFQKNTEHDADWNALYYDAIAEQLEPFWGKKMGTPKSKAAYVANWVISALSDFKGNIQARDILRLLWVASKQQHNIAIHQDRFLSPTALKNALEECGKAKIDEVKQEIRFLKDTIEKLDNSNRIVPLSHEDFQSLSIEKDEIQLMEEFGLFYTKDNIEYYLPEMYRQGLGLSYPKGARSKVVYLMRDALKKST